MKLRAIVIDRMASLRDLLAVALRDRGYEVYSYADPDSCPIISGDEDLCPQPLSCCDVLVIDNAPPEVRGLELIRRQLQGGCKSGTINKAVMAAEWSENDLAEACALGCKVFTKPFRFREFTAWLDSREKTIDPRRKLGDLNGRGRIGPPAAGTRG